jgi:hypothetical protein
MSGSDNSKDEPGPREQQSAGGERDSGRTGEGAASAMAHMISQVQQHRRHSGDAGEAAGSQHP